MTGLLFDHPNWVYLLREFDSLYRYGSAGGSKLIRSHRKRVRDRLSAIIDSNAQMVAREPDSKPVVEHLGRAFDVGANNDLHQLSKAFERIRDQVTWEYGYPKISRALAQRYAYAEVLGPRGPVRADDLILGFVLFAPNTTYPQHSHKDIEESYISVAGSWSENDFATYAPGSLILNGPSHEHRITTGQMEPCLLAFAWVGARERLADPDMKFSVTGRQKRK